MTSTMFHLLYYIIYIYNIFLCQRMCELFRGQMTEGGSDMSPPLGSRGDGGTVSEDEGGR